MTAVMHHHWYRHRNRLYHFRQLRENGWCDHRGNGWVSWRTRRTLEQVEERYGEEYEFRRGEDSW